MIGVTLLGVLTFKIRVSKCISAQDALPNISPYSGTNSDTKLYDKAAVFRSSVRGEYICWALFAILSWFGFDLFLMVFVLWVFFDIYNGVYCAMEKMVAVIQA